jgi:hypothetical protein
MILTTTRGDEAWRRAHRGKITPSDAAAFLARPGTRRRRALVERLVLDVEGVEQHTDEHPDPWAEQHEVDVRVAIAAYRRETGASVVTPGMIGSDVLTWLACSPHGLGDGGVVHTRTRRTARVFHVERGKMRLADRVRAQLTAWICDAAWCDVVDVWVPGYGLPDRQCIVREIASHEWVSENVLPQLTTVWRDVAASLQARSCPSRTARG